jgi:hypothetical protein
MEGVTMCIKSTGGPMRGMLRDFGRWSVGLAGVIAFHALLAGAAAQDTTPHEIGAVYYAGSSGFKALEKEAAPASGRANFTARIKGAHAAVRLAAGDAQKFRVCSGDPARYKLYALRSTKDSRDVTITKVNIWIGGAKSVLSQSENPVAIEAPDNRCFTFAPKEPLTDGEYGISPTGEEYAYTFGVGTAKP